MKTILALGNPGARYRDTRHNVGWWLADRLRVAWELPAFRPTGRREVSQGTVQGRRLELIKPLTYVNRAGGVLESVLDRNGFDPAADLLVLVDDVWLEPGTIRLRGRGSPGGHNGLASVQEAVGSERYGRLRIGVGRPPDDLDLAAWVLAPLPPAEEEAVIATFGRATEAAQWWLSEGMEAAMNRFN